MTPFVNVKSGKFNPDSKFILSVDYSIISLEIRCKDVLISRIQYPNTSSGLSYAKRVFNSLE